MTPQDYTDVIISRDTKIRSADTLAPPNTGELAEVLAPTPIVVRLAPEGHIYLVLPPGEVVTGSMAVVAAEEVERLADNRKLQMLLVLTGVEAVTKGARTIFSGVSVAAAAVLGVSPVDRVIANFLLGGAIQSCPTRYFSAESEAMAWLKRKITVA